MIPARGGSKRIPRKNLAPIHGEPAISITIRNLLKFNLFEKVLVSTDDSEIAKLAQLAGADVPYIRDKSLSDDYSSSEEVIRDVILKVGLQDYCAPIVCVYPLSVLLTHSDLQRGMALLKKHPDKFIISSVQIAPNPLRHSFKVNENGIEVIFPENNKTRSQDLPAIFYDCGLFYIALPQVWLNTAKYWYENNALAIPIPGNRAIDVDNSEDLARLKKAYMKSIQSKI